MPVQHDFRVGDPVVFVQENGGTLCDELSEDTQYYVVAQTDSTISVALTKGGDAITITQSGGTGTADSAGHVKIMYEPFGAVCQIQSWDLEIQRENLDVTTLKCGVGTTEGGKYAAFRKTQPGYASGTGTITVIFTDNDDALGQRMLDNVLLSSQEGARVRLFVNTVSDNDDTTPAPDLAASMYIEADVSLESMSLSVNPDDPVTAEVGYSISNVAHLFKVPVG